MSYLTEIVHGFKDSSLVIAGDLMLDIYVNGTPRKKRNPEGDHPIIHNPKVIYYPGGAANVFVNVSKLGGLSYLFGAIGEDYWGKILYSELQDNLRIESRFESGELSGIIPIKNRKTTVKRRIGIDGKTVLREDSEDHDVVDATCIENHVNRLKFNEKPGVLIFSDYDKGFLNQKTVELFKDLCMRYDMKSIVDPKPSEENLGRIDMFKGCYGITPNIEEACEISGLTKLSKLEEICGRCIDRLQPKGFLLITLGGNGMFLHEMTDGSNTYIPAVKVKEPDIVGAGDTSIAALSLALAAGATHYEAAMLANYAASIAVSKKGTATVKRQELIDMIKKMD